MNFPAPLRSAFAVSLGAVTLVSLSSMPDHHGERSTSIACDAICSTSAPLAGIYPVRFLAAGSTLRGFRFTREQIRSGLAWYGEAPPRRGRGWDDLLRRLLVNPGVRRWLETHQIDVRDLDDSFGGPKIN
jgi:hypothetical protein